MYASEKQILHSMQILDGIKIKMYNQNWEELWYPLLFIKCYLNYTIFMKYCNNNVDLILIQLDIYLIYHICS